MSMNATEWLERYAGLLGEDPPDQETVDALLDLAATAAHASERTAAPIACWLAGRSERPLAELQEAARAVVA
jgi:uncharacterized protein DUF6457